MFITREAVLMSKEITSNAYNFSEWINSGVDARTGAYSLSLFLGEFIVNKGNTSLPISINYDAGSDLDIGFGRGWSVLFSRFNRINNGLQLSSGQSFELKWNSAKNEYDIPYRKLKDVRVFYVSTTREVKIVYKNGKEEYLGWQDGELRRIVFPNGDTIYFDYGFFKFEQVIWRIRDNIGRELTIDWWSNDWETIVNHKLNENVIQNIIINKTGNGSEKRLNHITYNNLSFTTVEYRYIQACGYDVITSVTHPSGLVEAMTYLDKGHSLPSQAPLRNVPFITRHVIYSGDNQANRTTDYSYSDKNYLGFASDRAWVSGEDTLFKARSDYRYTTTEVINNEIKIERTYNKYHLMDHAVHSHHGKEFKREQYTYFADLSKGIESQSAIYSLVKKESVTFCNEKGNTHTYSREYEYDDYANPLKIKETDGSVTTFSYYPKNGAAGCPANPNGFVAQLKEQTFIPASDEFPSRSETFTYLSLPRLDDSDKNLIFLDSVLSNHTQITKQHTYYDDKQNLATYGRIKTETTIVDNKKRELSFDYTFKADSLETKTTYSTFDNLEQTVTETIDLFYGNVLETTDGFGIKTSFEYDLLGRKIRESVTPNTLYEATIRYQYSVGDSDNSVTVVDAQGNVHVTHMNNAGKPIYVELSGKEIKAMVYDAFGLLIEERCTDYLSGKTISSTTKYNYDANGEINRVEHPDGRVEKITQDLSTLTTVVEMVGLLTETTHFNISGLPVHKETRDVSNTLLASSKYTYDGYGNQLSITDTNERVTQFTYDTLDRLISTTRTLDGIDIVEALTYPSFLETDTPANVTLDGNLLGTQELDGFGRKISETSARGKLKWTYSNESPFPRTVTTAQGKTLRPTYDLSLGVLKSLEVDEEAALASIYQYDNTSGKLIQSQSLDSEQELIRDTFGRVTKETVVLNDGKGREATYTYSLMGKLEQKTDFFGNKSAYQYDDLGRTSQIIQEISNKKITTTITYDDFSRPYRYVTKDGADDVVIVNLTFNDLGMETQRSFTATNYSQSISNTFNTDQLLAKRVFNDSEGANVTENYTYNDLGYLTKYACTGAGAPKDEYGNTIYRQDFTYDKYGNVTQVISTFSDSSSNRMILVYDQQFPTRLISLSNTHSTYPSSVSLNYDFAGNLLNDEQGFSYQYNALEQVSSVSNNRDVLSEYEYDTFGQVISQTVDGMHTYLIYQQGELQHEVCGDVHTVKENNGAIIHRSVIDGQTQQRELLLTDTQGSVVAEIVEYADGLVTKKSRRYTAYGEEGK